MLEIIVQYWIRLAVRAGSTAFPLKRSAPACPHAPAVTPVEQDTTGSACRAMARRVTASTLGVLAYVTGLKICDPGIPVAMRIWRIRGTLQGSMVGPYQFHNMQ